MMVSEKRSVNHEVKEQHVTYYSDIRLAKAISVSIFHFKIEHEYMKAGSAVLTGRCGNMYYYR